MARSKKNTIALIENLSSDVVETLGPEIVAEMTPDVEILEPEVVVEPTTELSEPLVIEHEALAETEELQILEADLVDALDALLINDTSPVEEVFDATLPADEILASGAAEETEPQSEADADDIEFEDLLEVITPDDRLEMKHKIKAAFETREKFEKDKSAVTGNDNIFKNLTKSYGKLSSDAVANVLLVTNVEPDFVNRTLSDGSKYNVYALNKLADIAQGAMHGLDVNSGMSNAINLAVMKSMFAIRRVGATFTMDLAKAACSKQYRTDSPYVKHLIRHTVSPSTVSTQSSSTMQALQTLGVVKLAGSRKNASYEIIDSPLTRRLEHVLMAA